MHAPYPPKCLWELVLMEHKRTQTHIKTRNSQALRAVFWNKLISQLWADRTNTIADLIALASEKNTFINSHNGFVNVPALGMGWDFDLLRLATWGSRSKKPQLVDGAVVHKWKWMELGSLQCHLLVLHVCIPILCHLRHEFMLLLHLNTVVLRVVTMVDGGRELAWCLESRSCEENRARDGKMRQSWIGFMTPTHSNKAWEKSSLDPCDWTRFTFWLSCSVQVHTDHVALARRSSASGFWTGWSSWSWWGCWSWWSS